MLVFLQYLYRKTNCNCFFLISRMIIYFHVYIILDFPITYRNASVLCQSECTCLHKTINMVAYFVKSNENSYPKGRALMQMYRVVPITKRRSCKYMCFCVLYFRCRCSNWSPYISHFANSSISTSLRQTQVESNL